jgi:hypothetical protein
MKSIIAGAFCFDRQGALDWAARSKKRGGRSIYDLRF